ncbi:S41 family peptidase [Luteibaculum oceani]|uniref:S41 family peptidase n=1 Tax=Luteibaculum oceani TaxID=1294296 RepID=A0A5C6VJL2_9FLAO|nr:S41 family peptidase [Luteibaculum oceani]TXC85120.1 S41 family peptidase [Luteibaculum oceani]
MKNKFFKRPIAIATLVIVVFSSLAFTVRERNLFEIAKNIEIFTSMYREINMYYVDETKPGELMRTAIDAMLSSLDPYTVYISEAQIEDYRFMTNRVYGGIGATIRQMDGRVVISEPYPGFPAAKAKLKAGDEILAVDGESVKGKPTSEVSDRLKGQAGTKLKLKVLPYGSTQPKEVELERENVKMDDVSHFEMLYDSIGYVKLDAFTETASSEVKEALEQFKSNGAKGIILDLRGNGGGLLREAVAIVNFFVPKGSLVVTTKSRIEEQNSEHYALNEPLDTEIPLTVLVDERSASASEIVSGALQDLDRAVIIGSTTFGKGLVQNAVDLSYNSKLKLTIAKYYIPSGRCIQKIDYSERDEFGLPTEVPDSLLKKFQTKAGRPVMDGRGIEPDVKVEDEEAGRVIGGIYAKALFFKYANDYVLKHDSIVAPAKFRISDVDYAAFVKTVTEADIDYSTQSSKYLDKVMEVAKREKYFDDASEDFKMLSQKLEPNLNRDLEKFEYQIRNILENEIVSRYYAIKGRLQHSLSDDPIMDSAMKYLNPKLQSELLALSK